MEKIHEYKSSDFVDIDSERYFIGLVTEVVYPGRLFTDALQESLDWKGLGYLMPSFRGVMTDEGPKNTLRVLGEIPSFFRKRLENFGVEFHVINEEGLGEPVFIGFIPRLGL